MANRRVYLISCRHLLLISKTYRSRDSEMCFLSSCSEGGVTVDDPSSLVFEIPQLSVALSLQRKWTDCYYIVHGVRWGSEFLSITHSSQSPLSGFEIPLESSLRRAGCVSDFLLGLVAAASWMLAVGPFVPKGIWLLEIPFLGQDSSRKIGITSKAQDFHRKPLQTWRFSWDGPQELKSQPWGQCWSWRTIVKTLIVACLLGAQQ